MIKTEKKNTILHLWCCPRTLSTATMYSFAQRPDTIVYDEPLYASYLHLNPDLSRPYREKLLQEQSKNGSEFLQSLFSNFTKEKTLLVCKHITKQIQGINRHTLFHESARHVFLVRDPLDIISSWNDRESIHKEGCTLDNLCFPQMVQLYSEIRSKTGIKPIVIDSNLLKTHAHDVLTEVCAQIGIPFYHEQLSWPAGPKPHIDGYVVLFKHVYYYFIHRVLSFIYFLIYVF
jgi:hypothetical protein